VLVLSNGMALLLQTLAVRLGLVTGRDLAQACAAAWPRPIRWTLWLLAEGAIIACDLAELPGSAIALNLLFGIPLLWGAVITVLDVLLILALQRFGVRMLEAVVLALVLTIAGGLFVQVAMVGPDPVRVIGGLVPRLDSASLYIAIGILGATVMPHNLYLHSALVKTRRIEEGEAGMREAMRANLLDTGLSLNLALLVNAAILILAAAAFGARGIVVDDLRDAHHMLAPLLGGGAAALLFAVALLCSGPSATITGTLAGQIVMEGFLQLRLPPLVRRTLTRLVAVVPAVAVLATVGESGTLPLLIASQVVLSLQLPFAIVPLIRLTGSRALMGRWANRPWMHRMAVAFAALIIVANAALVVRTVAELNATMPWVAWPAAALGLAACALLAWLTFGDRSARVARSRARRQAAPDACRSRSNGPHSTSAAAGSGPGVGPRSPPPSRAVFQPACIPGPQGRCLLMSWSASSTSPVSRCAKSPSDTMPTSWLAWSTTGIRRTCRSPILSSALSTSSSS
jgi:manganese transport protein